MGAANKKPSPPWCFDPVNSLPGDLTALCLSFLDGRTLLGIAQHVSHSWRDAIDGRLPALWRDVYFRRANDVQLASMVEKSRGGVISLKVFGGIAVSGLHKLHFSDAFSSIQTYERFFGAMLSALPLLEDLLIEFPINGWNAPVHFTAPLQLLRSVCCIGSRSVGGLHNLPSLTKLELSRCGTDAGDTWPASLREVTISEHDPHDTRIIDRMAALQQPIAIDTDCTFLPPSSTQPCDQLAFLQNFATLQRLHVDFYYPHTLFRVHPDVFFNVLGVITSLHELHISNARITDQDMQCFSQLTNVQDIALCNIEELTSQGLSLLCPLPHLTKLSLESLFAVEDYSFIGLCVYLRQLRLCPHMSRDVSPSLAEAQAIAQLPHLEQLEVHNQFNDAVCVSVLFTVHSLRQLTVHSGEAIPATAFSSIRTMPCLDVLSISPIKKSDMSELVDCLVQMPRLKHIDIGCRARLSEQDEKRLRDALPRLEWLCVC